jgi:hypothetical protein
MKARKKEFQYHELNANTAKQSLNDDTPLIQARIMQMM